MKTQRSLVRRLAGQRGQALIETALTLPIVLVISISIFEFGRALQVWQLLTNAAREGARVAVLPGADRRGIKERVLQLHGSRRPGEPQREPDHREQQRRRSS